MAHLQSRRQLVSRVCTAVPDKQRILVGTAGRHGWVAPFKRVAWAVDSSLYQTKGYSATIGVFACLLALSYPRFARAVDDGFVRAKTVNPAIRE